MDVVVVVSSDRDTFVLDAASVAEVQAADLVVCVSEDCSAATVVKDRHAPPRPIRVIRSVKR